MKEHPENISRVITVDFSTHLEQNVKLYHSEKAC